MATQPQTIQGYSNAAGGGFTLPTTPATKPELNSFNQSMVNTSPTVLSNKTIIQKELPKIEADYQKYTQPYSPVTQQNPQSNQNQQTQQVTDFTNMPFSTRDGQNYYFNQTTGEYDIPDLGTNTALFANDPYSSAIAKNIEDARKKNDSALASALEGIKSRFEGYRQTQKDVNESGAAGARNALLQSEGGNRGSVSRFAAATADERVNTIIKDGNQALQDLDNKEKELVSATQAAYANEDFKYVEKLNSQIEKLRTEKLDAAKKVNDELVKETKKAKEAEKQASRENAIAGLYSQGVTDPMQILDYLNNDEQGNLIGDFNIKEVADTVGLLSGVGGTGAVGEYNFAKSQGYTGTFSEYQDEDANRKIKVAAASQNPGRLLTATEAQALGVPYGTTASQAYGKAIIKPPTEAQNREAVYAKRVTESNPIIDSLESTISNMNAVSFASQKSLENTAVGNTFVSDEIKQLRQAERNFATSVLRRESGASISPTEFATLEKQYFPRPGDDAKTLAQKKQARETVQKELIKSSGPAYGAEESTPSIGEQSAQTEQQAFQSLQNFQQANPDKQGEIYSNLKIIEQSLGRPATAQELLQAFPEYGTQSFNQVGSDTKQASKGVVSNVDISSYATDPQHETKIASIVNKIPQNGTFDYDVYIKSVAPKSPITGDMITTASSTYGVDPRLVLAIIQNDSSFGTKGHGAKNNNPGNIAQFDNLKGTVKGYKTLQDGILAVAKWLSNHKTTA